MSNVVKQSFLNVLSVIGAFAIGALNTVVLYPRIIGVQFYGIVIILLAQSNILQPIFSFGLQHTVIKYFSAASSTKEKDKLLLFSVLLPLCIIVPSALFFSFYYTEISTYLSSKNPGLAAYIYLIFVIAVTTSYFEIFYSWSRVQKRTVVGNFMKEVYQRVLIFVLLVAYFMQWLDFSGFINALIVGYVLRLLIMMGYSLWLYTPKIHFEFPTNTSSLLSYTLLIFLSAFGASVIIDIDASMLGKLVEEQYVAYYKVAIFIAAIIDAPGRALFQIVSPMVAEALNKNDRLGLKQLLRKSSTNLLLVSGLFFVLINSNIHDLYALIYQLNAKEGFVLAIPVVFYISSTKLISALIGCTNNIITNSKYYYVVPFLSIGSAAAVIGLNLVFISEIGFVGAALSTFLVITVFNLIKVAFVWWAYKIVPWGKDSLVILMLIVVLLVPFYFWQLPFEPLVNMVIKGGLTSLLYLIFSYQFKLSDNINALMDKGIKKLESVVRSTDSN